MKLKQILLFTLLLFIITRLQAQVNISGSALLPPRMTYSEIKSIVEPTAGMVVYDTEFNCLRFFNGSKWRSTDKPGYELGRPPGEFIGYQSTGPGNTSGECVVTDPSGNIYVTGSLENTATFGNTTLSVPNDGSARSFVAKMNSLGVWQWAVLRGGSGAELMNSIAVDLTGNVYVTGFFYERATFGDITLINPDFNSGRRNLRYVAKLNSSGVWQWAQTYGGSAFLAGISIAVDEAGDIYVSSGFNGSVTFGSITLLGVSSFDREIFIAKLNASGTWLWAVKTGGPDANVNSIAVDEAGNIYITGNINHSTTIGGLNVSVPRNEQHAYIAKLNSSGIGEWVKQVKGKSYVKTSAIALDGSGNVYVAGYFYGETSFPDLLSDLWERQFRGAIIFVLKLNNSGIGQWAAQAVGPKTAQEPFSADYMHVALAVDPSGDAYITGEFEEEITFIGCASLTSVKSKAPEDAFIAKTNSSGTWQWCAKAGGGLSDKGKGITLDRSGNIYVTGSFSNAAVFGNSLLTCTASHYFSYNTFVWKYSE